MCKIALFSVFLLCYKLDFVHSYTIYPDACILNQQYTTPLHIHSSPPAMELAQRAKIGNDRAPNGDCFDFCDSDLESKSEIHDA